MSPLKAFAFAIIAAFWLTMNFLLWRSEFRAEDNLGASVPTDRVWERMLTSPDDSRLDIIYDGRKIGYARWIPNVGEEITTGKVLSDTAALEGEIKKLSGYTVDIDGNVLLEESRQRIKFDLHIKFDTNMLWREFTLTTMLRPTIWTLRGSSDTQQLSIGVNTGGNPVQHTFTFDQILNSAGVLEMLGVPYLSALAPATRGTNGLPKKLDLGLEWSARQEWFKLGHSRVRTYNVQAHLLDQFDVNIIVSKVGEILRVQMPGKLKLVNEAFLTAP
jgi:hypothetical protein